MADPRYRIQMGRVGAFQRKTLSEGPFDILEGDNRAAAVDRLARWRDTDLGFDLLEQLELAQYGDVPPSELVFSLEVQEEDGFWRHVGVFDRESHHIQPLAGEIGEELITELMGVMVRELHRNSSLHLSEGTNTVVSHVLIDPVLDFLQDRGLVHNARYRPAPPPNLGHTPPLRSHGE